MTAPSLLSLTQLPAWAPLESAPMHATLCRLAGHWRSASIAADLAQRPQRVAALTWRAAGWAADLSKSAWDETVVAELIALARHANLPQAILALFDGALLNFTEKRAALHVAARDPTWLPPADRERWHDNEARMRQLVDRVRGGRWLNARGEPIRAVVNIGIGGSDVGPRLVVEALASWGTPIELPVAFVANLDPAELLATCSSFPPTATLYLVTSKSFSTAETLSNLTLARQLLAAALGLPLDTPLTHPSLRPHFIAITSNPAKAQALGFPPEQILWLPEWIGGRYSVWSAVGLPVALSFGGSALESLRRGAQQLDEHFRTEPLHRNLPVLLGLLGLWNSTYLGFSHTILLPYQHGLRLLPAWLQQLEMESNGKRVRRDGTPVNHSTAAAVWGMAGTLGQHAFHQWFYQGTQRVPLEFIAVAGGSSLPSCPILGDRPLPPQLAATLATARWATAANAVAQAEALLLGRTQEEAERALIAENHPPAEAAALAPHLAIPGNQPSAFLFTATPTIETLGALLALYEHATFVRGWLWGINPFDQYGVELGKIMARRLGSRDEHSHDPSTEQLRSWIGPPPSL
ncbi:MAG: glucose-6-phosphate isomerase [Hydrogenophilus sp.]|nr:glucose-6-phosphate isomerase [Hydrogenophilus sp.]